MISAGINIIANADQLHKVPVKSVYDSLRNPRPNIVSAIRQLRIVREIDEKQYGALKRQLPYLVCGMFNPPYRKTENFAYAEYFMIDIDHLSGKGLSVQETRRRIEEDSRVVLAFVSPGEDGLKVLFKLSERCYDSGVYSLFYKSFLMSFSEQYALQQVADKRTSDVTRACFISMDPDAYYNPDADLVNMRAFLDVDSPSALFELKRKQEQMLKENAASSPKRDEGIGSSDPDKEAMDRIKQLLNPKAPNKEKAPIFVPKELDEIMLKLKPYVEEIGVVISEVINIQYGKKIRFVMGLKQAEVNLFFGKKGFSVVRSPRSGTNAELNELMTDLVRNFISNY
ncbi:CRISPR-associated primase-polymerase type B [Parabacteroides sp.]|uniref:CRISPR-associated primase-polymerase type B n=1 Tax=Parabacteroides sp. TaxID=1869337 RepID=UPI00257A89FD|nr:CRISPR-associated primase-polymerase type B [Parabacteroides sp.]